MKLSLALLLVCSGFLLSKLRQKALARWAAWALVPCAIIAADSLTRYFAPWYRMVALITALFLAMKGVAIVYRYAGTGRLNVLQWLFFLAWPGMDALPFENLGNEKLGDRQALQYLRRGSVSLAIGVVLLVTLSLTMKPGYLPDHIFCLLAFPAFVLIFHGGIFDWGVAFYRCLGVRVKPLMEAPWKAESLGEFWGRRWNVAFIQMTQITLFLPLARRFNTRAALLLSFVVSGIFHEVAISLPVMEGFGLPTAYFFVQALLVLAERRLPPFCSRRIQQAWTFGCLLVPFPLLFHTPFLYQVVWPVMHAIARAFDDVGWAL